MLSVAQFSHRKKENIPIVVVVWWLGVMNANYFRTRLDLPRYRASVTATLFDQNLDPFTLVVTFHQTHHNLSQLQIICNSSIPLPWQNNVFSVN